MGIIEKAAKSEPKQIEVVGGRISIFAGQTKWPSENTINRHAVFYMVAFNDPPWDVYEWNITPKGARKEYTKLVSTVLKTGGALISFDARRGTVNHEGRGFINYELTPVGFNVVTHMSVFLQRLEEVDRFRRLPKDFRSPKQYFDTLSKIIGIPTSKFGEVGYLADVVVDAAYRKGGYGKELVKASLEYLRDSGKQYVLAWSVNPVMGKILQQQGFERITGIGDSGEGIDFLVHGGVWYPTLDIPAKGRTTLEGTPVVAEHYFKVTLGT